MRVSGKQVAAARELLGISAAELGVAAGVSGRTIERFEAGDVEPRPASLAKILAALGERGIEFTNGTGIGVRLDYEKTAAYVQATLSHDPKTSDR